MDGQHFYRWMNNTVYKSIPKLHMMLPTLTSLQDCKLATTACAFAAVRYLFQRTMVSTTRVTTQDLPKRLHICTMVLPMVATFSGRQSMPRLPRLSRMASADASIPLKLNRARRVSTLATI